MKGNNMINEFKSQMFRLATVLYADNNYDVKPKTIHKKIIESALLDFDAKESSIHELIDYIQNKYNITFDEESIKEIVTGKKSDSFYCNFINSELFICLSEKRRQILKSKISNKTIDYFIDDFNKEFQKLVANRDSKEIIYRFLYEIFSTNITSFQKLLDNKKNLSTLINLESTNYSLVEKDILNTDYHGSLIHHNIT